MSEFKGNRITVQCLAPDNYPLLTESIINDSIEVTAPPGTARIVVETGWRPGRLTQTWINL